MPAPGEMSGTDAADRAPSDPVYDVIAAFAAQLAAEGVVDVVISPGSRSTPLALTFHARPDLTTWIQLDERSAGFFALGQARATGRPSVLVCTSGTAAANYLPAVVEAHHAGVPMIVCTADRPPELRGWGAGQTIDQVGIYGSCTRWAADLPVAGDWTPHQARMAAIRAVDAATGVAAGPVHLNWPLREPLEPVGAVPIDVPGPRARTRATSRTGFGGPRADSFDADLPRFDPDRYTRGVVVVGPDAEPTVEGRRRIVDAAARAGARLGWPVVGEPLAGVRRTSAAGAPDVRIAGAAHLLAVESIAEELRPDVVVRIGGSPTTKPVRRWMERHRPTTVLIDPARRWNEASFTLAHHVAEDIESVLRALTAAASRFDDRDWLARWVELDGAAAAAIAGTIGGGPLLSALTARTLADAVPAGTLVMTSNSMPVRDLDGFVALDGPEVGFVGNRGASGIDGITSTALGLASRHTGPVVLFTGDLALLHDLGALVGAARAGLHLTVVCVDNDGGGIFSMLPVAGRSDAVDATDFETLFRTPHGLDLAGFDGIGGVRSRTVTDEAALRGELARATADTTPGVDLLVVPVDRDADVAQRRAVTEAVRTAFAR